MSGADGRRTGRRPGNQDTRATIVDAARELFIAKGFRSASVREVAERAGVDPALIYHYFASKRDLLLATVRLSVNPVNIMHEALAGGPGPTGVRLIGALTRVWESPHGESMAAVISGALSEPAVRALIADTVGNVLVPTVMESLEIPAAERDLRGGLLESVLAGLILGRYVVGVEPLASLPRRAVVSNLGEVVEHLLFGRIR